MAGGSLSERHNGHQHSAGHRTSKLVFSTARESAFSQLTSMGHLPGVVLEPTRHVQGSSDDRSNLLTYRLAMKIHSASGFALSLSVYPHCTATSRKPTESSIRANSCL